MTNLSDKSMAAYWARRVAELEAMRPIEASEALAEASRLESLAADRDARVAAAENVPMESGYVEDGDTVQGRMRRNHAVLGASRRAVWGETTRALQDRGMAKALRGIAQQPIGTALAESLAEARQRAEYYAKLCGNA